MASDRPAIELPDGSPLELRADRTAWWPTHGALLVADLHWGRDASYRVNGMPVPEGLLTAELDRLGEAIDEVQPRAVYVLGDLVHASDGLTDRVVDEVARFRARWPVEMHVIRGNHDRHTPRFADRWHLVDHGARCVIGDVLLVHDPADTAADDPWWIAGHLHPTARFRFGRSSVRVPAFAATARGLVLPAFTDVARGVCMTPDAETRVWAVTDGQVLAAPPRRATAARSR